MIDIVKIIYLLIFLEYKYITDSINMLRIKLEDLLLFLVLIRLAPGFSFHPSRILSCHLLLILSL